MSTSILGRFLLLAIEFWVVLRPDFRCQTDLKRISNGFQVNAKSMPSQSQSNQPYTNVGYINLINLTYENNIKVEKQPFLKNNGKSMAKQWQLLFLESEVLCETVVFISLFLFKQPLAELFIELLIFIDLVLYVF